MRFDVETGGRRRTIEVRRLGAGWAVHVDGRARSASLVQVGSRWSLLLGEAGRPARSYELAIVPRGRGEYVVAVNGRSVTASILDPRTRTTRARSGSVDAVGPRSLVSPMPGRVVKVLVAPGDAVTARQGLVVVEAMKMENELRAPSAGTVTEVRVHEGMTVEAQTVLVVIDAKAQLPIPNSQGPRPKAQSREPKA